MYYVNSISISLFAIILFGQVLDTTPTLILKLKVHNILVDLDDDEDEDIEHSLHNHYHHHLEQHKVSLTRSNP